MSSEPHFPLAPALLWLQHTELWTEMEVLQHEVAVSCNCVGSMSAAALRILLCTSKHAGCWLRGCRVLTPCPVQDPVLPGHEPVPGADVHLLLVLRAGRHADRRPHLQVHRIPRVRARQGLRGWSSPRPHGAVDAGGPRPRSISGAPGGWSRGCALRCCCVLQGGEGMG